jgi:hypothetical protein
MNDYRNEHLRITSLILVMPVLLICCSFTLAQGAEVTETVNCLKQICEYFQDPETDLSDWTAEELVGGAELFHLAGIALIGYSEFANGETVTHLELELAERRKLQAVIHRIENALNNDVVDELRFRLALIELMWAQPDLAAQADLTGEMIRLDEHNGLGYILRALVQAELGVISDARDTATMGIAKSTISLREDGMSRRLILALDRAGMDDEQTVRSIYDAWKEPRATYILRLHWWAKKLDSLDVVAGTGAPDYQAQAIWGRKFLTRLQESAAIGRQLHPNVALVYELLQLDMVLSDFTYGLPDALGELGAIEFIRMEKEIAIGIKSEIIRPTAVEMNELSDISDTRTIRQLMLDPSAWRKNALPELPEMKTYIDELNEGLQFERDYVIIDSQDDDM